MSFAPGSRVQVAGLASAQQHNGKVGTVCGAADESTGRCSVLLDDGSQLTIKPCNLTATDVPMAAQVQPPPSAASAAVAAPSAAEMSRMSIVRCLQALLAIEDAAARRARTVEVHQLMAAQWRQSSRYKSTMARHLVEDVRVCVCWFCMPCSLLTASPPPPAPLQVHPMFRTGFLSVLQKSQAAGAVDAPAFSRINQSLHHHHQAEDSMWFPGFRRQHPELKACIDALEAEHAQLVRLEARVMKGDMQVRQPQRLHSSAIFLRFDAHAGVAAVLRRIVRPSEPRGNDECAVFYGRYSGVLRCVQPARARLYSARMCCRGCPAAVAILLWRAGSVCNISPARVCFV